MILVSLQPINAIFAGVFKIFACLKILKSKSFNSKNTYLQHLNSKKHKDEEEISKNKANNVEQIIKEPKNELTTLQDFSICLFCNLKLPSIPEYLHFKILN